MRYEAIDDLPAQIPKGLEAGLLNTRQLLLTSAQPNQHVQI